MKNIVIFDLDGTLADCEHRRHFVEPPLVTEEDCNMRDYQTCLGCQKPFETSHLRSCAHIHYWKPDWESFFREDLIMADEPIEAVVELYRRLRENLDLSIVICTGRMEKHRHVTEKWLSTQEIIFNIVPMMRADDDFREDWIVKEEMLAALGGPERVIFAVDDRNQTVQMWRRHGITCFQCAEGDF